MATNTPPVVIYEAAPDVQVYLHLTRCGKLVEDLEANINISKTTYELKLSLSKPLSIPPENMQIFKGGVQLQDNIPLSDYDIACDDTLEVRDTTC